MKRCSRCGKKMTRDLHLLSNGDVVEEYKNGLCVHCWILEHKHEIQRLKAMATY